VGAALDRGDGAGPPGTAGSSLHLRSSNYPMLLAVGCVGLRSKRKGRCLYTVPEFYSRGLSFDLKAAADFDGFLLELHPPAHGTRKTPDA